MADPINSADILLFERFRFDRRGGGLFYLDGGGPVALGSRAREILALLIERGGDLVSKDEIMQAVWPNTVVEDGNLTVHISTLRRVLDQGRLEGSSIQTVPGRGYRFVGQVIWPEPNPPPSPEAQQSPAHAALEAAGRLDLTFDDLGEQTVKNIVRPIRAYALTADAVAALPRAEDSPTQQPTAPTRPRYLLRWIAALSGVGVLIIAGSLWWLWPLTNVPAASATAPPFGKTVVPAVPRLSIVVLPFVNLSDDPKQQYFVDGVTDDLTTDLSRIGSFVISRNTAFTYKDKPLNAKQIGHELGVRYVLEGSVRRLGNHVRVNAQLIDAETNAHLWADRFDRDVGDLLALQNEITKRIAVALNLALVRTEAARPTANPDALDYIFRGRAALSNKHTRDSYAEQVSLFEHALALDPRSAEAQAHLANSLVARTLDYMTDTANNDIARAEDLVGKALTASPNNAMAHHTQGQILRAKGRCREAIPEYETALAANPNLPFVISVIGRCKIFIGLIDEGIPLLEQAILLSPRDANLGAWDLWVGQAHLLQSRTDEAILWFEKACSVSGPATQDSCHVYLASAYALKGDTERAAAELAEAQSLGKLHGQLHFSIAYWRARSLTQVGEQPKVIALFETTFIAGLRKAGMPEE